MRWHCLLAIGLFIVAVGCGQPLPEGAQPTRPITAIVNYNGAPVEGATVTFISQGENPASAVGRTDAQGKAAMRTYNEGDGAVLAKHKVMISKIELPPAAQTAPVESDDYVPPGPGGAPLPVAKNHLPAKYASPTTTDLTVEVTSSGPSEVTFDLKD